MLTDVQAYCMTFAICLFRPEVIAAAIYRKTAEAKLYTKHYYSVKRIKKSQSTILSRI